MYNLYLELAYKGTNYSGSQLQKNSITIQELLNSALKRLLNQKSVKTIFSGRTDAGVHANQQPVNVLVSKKLPEKNIIAGLNSYLPADIVVKKATYKDLSFNARFSAKNREYLYNIYNGQENLPLTLADFVWFINKKLDIKLMRRSARLIKGEQDFSSFCAANGSTENKIRTVFKSEFTVKRVNEWPGSEKTAGILITYKIKANSFLYHMVRNIIAALVDVGLGKISLSDFKKILAKKNRTKLKSITAPAQGLVLHKVSY